MSTVDSGGVRIHYELHGPADGRPVVLLHGFPDTGRLWRGQVPVLAGAGHLVVVPDLRGAGLSGKPREVEAYDVVHLATDVLAVLDDAGIARSAVVGHDWGAAVAWVLATFSPDRVSRMAALSVGHPAAFRGAGLAQRERSWYMLLFQFPDVAERWLSDDGWARMREWSSHPDVDGVIADLEACGSLTSSLGWYRANVAPETWIAPPPELPPVQVPVMGIWSSGDFALTEEQMTASAAHCGAGFRYERLEDLGHWLQLEDPAAVNRLLLDFLD